VSGETSSRDNGRILSLATIAASRTMRGHTATSTKRFIEAQHAVCYPSLSTSVHYTLHVVDRRSTQMTRHYNNDRPSLIATAGEYSTQHETSNYTASPRTYRQLVPQLCSSTDCVCVLQRRIVAAL